MNHLVYYILFIMRHFNLTNGKISRLNVTEERVVGGVDIPIDQFVPYQVSLQYFTRNGEHQHFCGGSIIAPNRILTAAHCCQGLIIQRISVVAGIRDLNSTLGARSYVVDCEIHPNYQKLKTSDIAVIKIEPHFHLNNKSIAAIDIDGRQTLGKNVRVTLTGWGLRLPVPFPFVSDATNYPQILQTMSYFTISNRECMEKGLNELTSTEICAQGFPLKGACSGDSGGPLVRLTNKGFQQVGIVSYGLFICGVFNVPDVYTRVSKFHDWLIQYLF